MSSFQALFDKLLNALLPRVVQASQAGQPRIGLVQSYDPEQHAVRVTIQPEDVMSGWIPVGVMAAGGGTFRAAPSLNSQVVILPQEGDIENGIVVCSLHSVADPVPKVGDTDPNTGTAAVPLQPGEGEWVGNGGGSALRMTQSGVVVIGDLGVSGDIVCKGNVSDSVGTLNGLRQHYDSHAHPGVQSGSSQTGTTTQPDPGSSSPAPDPFLA
jgi:hypothetical protein